MALYRGTRKEKEKSFMYDHCTESHGGVMGPTEGQDDFKMEITSHSSKPLERILEEGVTVKELVNSQEVNCLNTKKEYYHAQFISVSYSQGAPGMDPSRMRG